VLPFFVTIEGMHVTSPSEGVPAFTHSE